MFTSAMQLKDWIKNKSTQTGVPANTLLQNYMMERLLERIAYTPTSISRPARLLADAKISSGMSQSWATQSS
jgi:hypothetical protein